MTPWHMLAEIIVEMAALQIPYSQDSEKLAEAEENLLAAAEATVEAWDESCRCPQAVKS